jgi:hypothetical protein
MTSDQDRTYGATPGYSDKDKDLNKDFNTPSDQGRSDLNREQGIAPEYRDRDQGMSSDWDREHGLAPKYDKDFNTPDQGTSSDQELGE